MRPELLAPAGSPEALRAAVQNGADAVYLASDRFGMRARAANFALEDIPAAEEIAHALDFPGWEFRTLKEAHIDSDPAEDADSFLGNARIKAKAAWEAAKEALGHPVAVLADDSGLEVDALDGAPGVHSARYTGRHDDTDAARNELLLHNLGARTDRTARFVSCICCTFPNGDVLRARGTCEGSILFAPRGENGFGYDPLFLPDGYDCSMAELRPEEKNAISHRGNALKILKEELRNYYADK